MTRPLQIGASVSAACPCWSVVRLLTEDNLTLCCPLLSLLSFSHFGRDGEMISRKTQRHRAEGRAGGTGFVPSVFVFVWFMSTRERTLNLLFLFYVFPDCPLHVVGRGGRPPLPDSLIVCCFPSTSKPDIRKGIGDLCQGVWGNGLALHVV